MKKVYNIMMLSLVVSATISCATMKGTVLDKKWPEKPAFTDQFDIDPPLVKEGYIITRSNDTLNGYFKLRQYSDYQVAMLPLSFLPMDKTRKKDIFPVSIDTVNDVRVNEPVGEAADLVPLGSTLWQVSGSKNGISVLFKKWIKSMPYDSSDFWEYDEMVIVRGQHIVTRIPLYDNKLEIHHRNGPAVLRFINEHYHQEFSGRTFRSQREMIYYILDQENLAGH
jgi:hypothetical protein